MLSNKPYLIRAFYEWIVDSGCTPFVVVNANYPRCNVPQAFVENGEITLNVSPTAVRDLKITNDAVEFCASFSGIVHIISAPIKAVLAIYAQENQQGMFFDYDEVVEEAENELNEMKELVQSLPPSLKPAEKGKASHLRLVDTAHLDS